MSVTLLAGSLLLGLAVGGATGWQLAQRQRQVLEPGSVDPLPSADDPAPPTDAIAYQRALALAQYQAGFLANTSHELRSPLNQVISLHQLIQADLCESPEEERLFLTQAQEATTRALQNLDLLTAISKLELGRSVPDLQPVQVADLLGRLHQLVGLQSANRNCRLHIVAASDDLYGLSDPNWLQQAVVLLIEGAIAAESRQILIWATTLESGSIAISLAHDSASEAWQIAAESSTAITSTSPDRVALKKEPLATLSPFFRQQLAAQIVEKIQGQLSLSSEVLDLPAETLGNAPYKVFKLLIPALGEDC